ncbi:unnamed protein product [Arabidopsis thaliana]|uniref:RNA-binding (RRM/RBD/RNP motifs) family protein n=1 Tax=Arabidopsis thaliana TaxID=3702 RepID=A0A5S9YDR4_ARATH|nr:unnamed protein product [Arabidopsis thaliana]
MEESASKGLESKDTNNRKCFSKISVEGYDTSVHEFPLKLALAKHFASCGKIVDIDVPRDFKKRILKSPLFIIFHAKEGESPVDKALELSGTDVGGWNVVVKSLPGQQMYRDPGGVDRFKGERTLIVKVYDTPSTLSKIDLQIGLCKHFSSCGEVTGISVLVHGNLCCHESKARVDIMGKGCVDKALELSGRTADGWKIVVYFVVPPAGRKLKPTGSGHPTIGVERMKKAELKKKAKMEMMDKGKKKRKTTE